jgi:hypothetical protein
MARDVKITSRGIKKVLKNYNYKSAFAEYLWNGFDAKATELKVDYKANELGLLEYIVVSDNGYGIDLSKIKQKFDKFYDSEKAIVLESSKHNSTLHGKNGVGRLTFFNFASLASWETTYHDSKGFKSGTIIIDTTSLDNYKESVLINNNKATGTKVTFTNFQDKIKLPILEVEIIPFLKKEFCWFLELNRERGYKIIVNGTDLTYEDLIRDREDFPIGIEGIAFNVRYVQWALSLNKEYSKFYFINDKNEEVFKDYTTLNNKGDHFYHSIFIKSDFFNDFDFKISPDKSQVNLFAKAKTSPDYKLLIKNLNDFLRSKRKPFLKEYAAKLVESYESDSIFPEYNSEWENKYRKAELEETIKGLYEAQPKIFTNLNLEQKKTFVRFLDLLLDSNERENIFTILDQIVEIEPEERKDLADLFKTTKLNRIIETIKLVEDRYKTYYKLKDLVFNEDLKADEVHHLQKLIESHYWFFGEQYHLVTAAEPKFEEALRRYIYLLTEKDENIDIDHANRLKEMDIFACRQNTLVDRIENIVVELKHPKINLGSSQYSQVTGYLELILKQQEFNAPNMFWEFYLIGNKFDTTSFIKNLINTNKPHGNRSLILNLEDGRIKVYAKTWSEIFAEFEIKHKYLDDKLKLERYQLTNELHSANEVVLSVKNNTAVQPKEVNIP